MNRTVSKIVVCVALLVFAVVCFFPLAEKGSAPERYTRYVQSIDEKTGTVLKLTATSTATSAAVSALPGDAATPIAEKLADFSEYFLLILCVLYAEKYLLTLLPLGVFKLVLPLSCLLFIIGRFWNPRLMDQHARKLALLGLALLVVIPLSVKTSDLVYDTYQESIDSTIASAEGLIDESVEESVEQESKGVLGTLVDGINGAKTYVKDKTEEASEMVKRFVETLAIMIVTSCVIPILVLVFFVALVKQLTGIDLRELAPRGERLPRREAHEEEREHAER